MKKTKNRIGRLIMFSLVIIGFSIGGLSAVSEDCFVCLTWDPNLPGDHYTQTIPGHCLLVDEITREVILDCGEYLHCLGGSSDCMETVCRTWDARCQGSGLN